MSAAGQVQPGVRHPVRRRPAPLRGNLQRVRAPVSTAWTNRPWTRSKACPCHCHRPDQPGAQFALHRGHHDRAERPPSSCWFARAGQLFDRQTAQPVRHDSPASIYAELGRAAPPWATRASCSLSPWNCPPTPRPEQMAQWLSASGFTNVQAEREHEGKSCSTWWPTAFAWATWSARAAVEAIEVASSAAAGAWPCFASRARDAWDLWRFSTGLHCPDSDLRYAEPKPSMFSFNSAVGACDTCRGFGRVIGVDWGLVIPNDWLTPACRGHQAIQTPAWAEVQDDLMRHAEQAGIPRDTPWYQAHAQQQGDWRHARLWPATGTSSGTASSASSITRRARPTRCTSACCCLGAPQLHRRAHSAAARARRPRAGCGALAPAKMLMRAAPEQRCMPQGVAWTRAQGEALPGLCLHRPDAAAAGAPAPLLRPALLLM